MVFWFKHEVFVVISARGCCRWKRAVQTLMVLENRCLVLLSKRKLQRNKGLQEVESETLDLLGSSKARKSPLSVYVSIALSTEAASSLCQPSSNQRKSQFELQSSLATFPEESLLGSIAKQSSNGKKRKKKKRKKKKRNCFCRILRFSV